MYINKVLINSLIQINTNALELIINETDDDNHLERKIIDEKQIYVL